MNEIELIDKWAAKLEAALVQFGDKGADIALTLGWVGSFQTVGVGLILLIITIVLLSFFFRNLKRFEANKQIIREMNNNHNQEEWRLRRAELSKAEAKEGTLGLLCVTQGASAILFFLFAIYRLVDIYAWIGLYRPEVFLAARALGW